MQLSRETKEKEICLIFVQSDLIYSKDRDTETPVQSWYYV